jgi:hypothetical protein
MVISKEQPLYNLIIKSIKMMVPNNPPIYDKISSNFS